MGNASTEGFGGPVVALANGNSLADLSLFLTDSTAPAAVQVGANNSLSDLAVLLSPQCPVGIDAVNVTNSLQGVQVDMVPAGGIGVRLLANGNTLRSASITGSGVGQVTGVLVAAATTNNFVANTQFVRLLGGSPVNNLGGATNGIGPIVTSATLGAATNPFANYLH